MPNAYLIDTFLSATAFIMLTYLYFELLDKVPKLSQCIDKHSFEVALNELLKPSLWLASPFIIVLLFCIWRFYALMQVTGTFGAGGVGLMLMMAVFGIGMILLDSLVTLVLHSHYASPLPDTKQDKAKIPISPNLPPNTPLSEVGSLADPSIINNRRYAT